MDPFYFYQKVQENIYKEQIEIFGENGYSDNVEKIHLTKMKYLGACIKVCNYPYFAYRLQIRGFDYIYYVI